MYTRRRRLDTAALEARGHAKTYAERIVAAAEPGSIILMHIMYGANELARDALPLVIEGLHARGFSIVPAGALLDRAAAARP